jgi:hypothetical protein
MARSQTKVLALSVRQPHASMIANATKNVEYRTWSTKWRGDLLICASGSVPALRQYGALPRGCALAVVTLVDVIEVEPKMYAWVLGNVRLMPSIPGKGRQRLWRV